jgi:hypothetical protein
VNNLDMSSSGVNLVLNCYRDCNNGRSIFEESMKHIIDISGESYYLFTDNGNFETSFDFSDISNYTYTKDDLRKAIIELYTDVRDDSEIDYLDKDCLHNFGCNFNKCTKEQLVELISYIDDKNEIIKSFINNLSHKFELLSVTGFSQGDYSKVVFRNSDIEEYCFDDRDSFLEIQREYFTNLIYSTPITCSLEIDGEEECLDEFLDDAYNYDKDKILDGIKNHIVHEKLDYIVKWLEENLATDPEYIN